MKVTVVWASPLIQDIVEVELPVGTTVADAVARSGLIAQYGLDPTRLKFAVFGRGVRADARLADGDRVELTRPLEADPKMARARRAQREALTKPARPSKTPNSRAR